MNSQVSAHPGRTHAWSRRDFVKGFAGGMAVLWLVDPRPVRAQAKSGRSSRGGQRRPTALAAWLHIAADGTVTLYSGKVEIGQNVRTSLTACVAEELETPISSVKAVLGDTTLVPWDGGTSGSRSTPDMVPQIRRAAATAREALIDLAAKKWSVDRPTLTAADGKIRHAATNRAIGYGELTQGEKFVLEISNDVKLKPATEWKVLGTPVPKVDARRYVTGRHTYTSDLSRPGMLHGRVLRPPAFGATLVSLDASGAEVMRGVSVVRDGSFVGVVAADEHLAGKALAALRPEWKTTPQVSEGELFAHLRATARNAPPATGTESTAPGVLRQTYTVAYIAHAPLEPRVAVAEWQDEKLTVWTGSQRPFGVRDDLIQAFRLPEANVRVFMPDMGSGYGGKHSGEAAVEAARLARGCGKPVKLAWTREEEFTWAYFRPAGVIDITSAVTPDGRLTRWEHHNYNSGNAGIRAVYDLPERKEEYHASQSPLRQGSYRALAATANHFARETHIDEVARAVKLDPVEFRLKNLQDPRARAVLEAAARTFGWGQSTRRDGRGDGRGIGVAIGFDKGGYVATCAEIAIEAPSRRVRVVRVVESFECGAILNPDHLRHQIEGCIVQGLGGALFEAIRFDHGRILNPKFSQYRVPRFSDLPAIEVVMLNRKDLTSAGAGEAPILGIAPAVGNAIYDATGIRLRSLPLAPNGVRA